MGEASPFIALASGSSHLPAAVGHSQHGSPTTGPARCAVSRSTSEIDSPTDNHHVASASHTEGRTPSDNKLVRRTERRVGFRFTPHDLRHTFVTTLRRQGVALEVVSKLVTHRSITTTADTYSHLNAADLRAELERAGWSSPIGDAA